VRKPRSPRAAAGHVGWCEQASSLGAPGAPFLRFPALKHPPEMVTYLGQRNIAIFSTDIDSFDFTMRTPWTTL
jgi:hypothetical protein